MNIDDFVLNTTKKKRYTVHGARALNKQLPPTLQRPTKDWDLWARNPQQAMDKMEDQLDVASGGDNYYEQVVPLIGSQAGEMVYRVISRITGEPVVDFMKTPNHKNLYKIISGIRWETLEHAKLMYQKILSNPACMHRWAKARGDLRRIEAFERQLGKEQSNIQINNIPGMFKITPIRFKPLVLRGW